MRAEDRIRELEAGLERTKAICREACEAHQKDVKKLYDAMRMIGRLREDLARGKDLHDVDGRALAAALARIKTLEAELAEWRAVDERHFSAYTPEVYDPGPKRLEEGIGDLRDSRALSEAERDRAYVTIERLTAERAELRATVAHLEAELAGQVRALDNTSKPALAVGGS